MQGIAGVFVLGHMLASTFFFFLDFGSSHADIVSENKLTLERMSVILENLNVKLKFRLKM